MQRIHNLGAVGQDEVRIVTWVTDHVLMLNCESLVLLPL